MFLLLHSLSHTIVVLEIKYQWQARDSLSNRKEMLESQGDLDTVLESRRIIQYTWESFFSRHDGSVSPPAPTRHALTLWSFPERFLHLLWAMQIGDSTTECWSLQDLQNWTQSIGTKELIGTLRIFKAKRNPWSVAARLPILMAADDDDREKPHRSAPNRSSSTSSTPSLGYGENRSCCGYIYRHVFQYVMYVYTVKQFTPCKISFKREWRTHDRIIQSTSHSFYG